MRKRITLYAVLVLVTFAVPTPPVFAQRGAPDCLSCKYLWDYDANKPNPQCTTPDSGMWGSDVCHVDCITLMQTNDLCVCDDTQSQCMYYQVCC